MVHKVLSLILFQHFPMGTVLSVSAVVRSSWSALSRVSGCSTNIWFQYPIIRPLKVGSLVDWESRTRLWDYITCRTVIISSFPGGGCSFYSPSKSLKGVDSPPLFQKIPPLQSPMPSQASRYVWYDSFCLFFGKTRANPGPGQAISQKIFHKPCINTGVRMRRIPPISQSCLSRVPRLQMFSFKLKINVIAPSK